MEIITGRIHISGVENLHGEAITAISGCREATNAFSIKAICITQEPYMQNTFIVFTAHDWV